MRKRAVVVIATLAALSLAGCAYEKPSAEPSYWGSGAIEHVVNPTETPSLSTNARGNVEKVSGESFGISQTTGQTAAFVVTAVTVDPVCTVPSAQEPERGHFVRVDVEGASTDDLSVDLTFAPKAWTALSTDGLPTGGPSDAADACLGPQEKLPDVVGPGETVSGSIVLDVADTQGMFVLEAFRGLRWEWAY